MSRIHYKTFNKIEWHYPDPVFPVPLPWFLTRHRVLYHDFVHNPTGKMPGNGKIFYGFCLKFSLSKTINDVITTNLDFLEHYYLISFDLCTVV